jgi:release factor glutamine methyltransferase
MNENLQPAALDNKTWLEAAASQLKAANITSYKLDVEIILGHTLRKPRTYLHAHPDELLELRDKEIADARLALRLERVPIAYIIGHKEFYGRRFSVTTATLIPRPESESLIELLRTVIPANKTLLPDMTWRLIDIGTGSGALGITSKLEFPELNVTLSDISNHALKVAGRNAKLLHADVQILRSDLLQEYPFAPQIILANLPYVNPDWPRSVETNFEPEMALFASDNGTSVIKKLIDQAASRLPITGYLLLEADPEQHEILISYAKNRGLLHVKTDGYGLLLQKTK